jgi:hypothetical protein
MMGELERSETLPPPWVSERASNFEPSELYETKLREGAQVANAGQRSQRVAAGRPTARFWYLVSCRHTLLGCSGGNKKSRARFSIPPSGCTTERRGGEHQDQKRGAQDQFFIRRGST